MKHLLLITKQCVLNGNTEMTLFNSQSYILLAFIKQI